MARPERCTAPASQRWSISCSNKHRNVWGVTDMSTGQHNGFTDGVPNNPTTINHTATGDVSTFIGVFGNNVAFVPTSGPNAGEIFPFAYGPTRCGDDRPDLCRQHAHHLGAAPGRGLRLPARAPHAQPRMIELLDLDGTLFTQNRTRPRSSNWPSNIEDRLLAHRGPV